MCTRRRRRSHGTRNRLLEKGSVDGHLDQQAVGGPYRGACSLPDRPRGRRRSGPRRGLRHHRLLYRQVPGRGDRRRRHPRPSAGQEVGPTPGQTARDALAFQRVRLGRVKRSQDSAEAIRHKRRRDLWLVGALVLISLFALGYFFVEAKQAAFRSVIRPFTLSERPPQPQNVEAPATGGEEKSDESAKETNVYAEATSTKA